MKKIVLTLALALPSLLYPCTTLSFLDDHGDRIFGKSFDWYFSHGISFVNKRNVKKIALLQDSSTPLVWTSKFGSVTFNQHGRDFPLSGMNEAGLVVEIMIGPVQDIPQSTSIRNVDEVQLIQYMLDSFQTIPEVIAGLQNLRVNRVASNVHYLVCDRASICTTVEYLGGNLVLHNGSSLPYNAFTNDSYDDSEKYASGIVGLGGATPLPTSSDSLARFARAANEAKSYHAGDAVSYVNDFLDQVALSGKWRITYHGLQEIFFRVDPNLTQLKVVQMNFDYSCSSPVKTFRMDTSAQGDVSEEYVDYSQSDNLWLVNQNFMLPANLRAQMVTYPETHTQCLDGMNSNL